MNYFKEKLQNELTRRLGLEHCLLTSSCRNALYLVLANLELQEGDEVIIQSFICGSLPLAIEKAGGKVVFVEVNKETFNLDGENVKKNITPKTRAIIFVHTYGNPSGIAEVAQLCKDRKIILIEDIAHAFGARYDHKLAGTFGDYAVYSFTKQMINGGGGVILTNNSLKKIVHIQSTFRNSPSFIDYCKRIVASLYETRAFFLSKLIINFVHRQRKLQLTNNLSPHFSCSEMEAFLAWKQLSSLPRLILKRRKNYLFLSRAGAQLQTIFPLAESSYNYLSFIFPTPRARDRALTKNSLFLPPWSGSSLSEKLIFVPNNPFFTKKRLLQFRNATTIFIKKKNSPLIIAK